MPADIGLGGLILAGSASDADQREGRPVASAPSTGESAVGAVGESAAADAVRAGWLAGRPAADRRRKAWTLGGIALLGLAIRVLLVLVVHPTCPGQDEAFRSGAILEHDGIGAYTAALNDVDRDRSCFSVRGDPMSTVVQARMIAEGRGMSSPVLFTLIGRDVPGAARPPAWTLVISAMNVAGLDAPTEARLAAGVLGALSVFVIGHLGWQLAGRSAGIAAALVAAINPNLLINDWHLLNDGPFALVCALMLWAAYRLWVRPTSGRAATLGAAIALGFYTRAEALLLIVFMVPPLVYWLRGVAARQRATLGAVAVLVTLALVFPYWAWNMTRFNNPQPTIGGGVALLTGSCDATYFGERIGMVGFECLDAHSQAVYLDVLVDLEADESDVDQDNGERARAYIEANIRRVPIVVLARVARVYGLFRPAQTTQFDVDIEERGAVEPWLGLFAYYTMVPLSVAGLVHLRRRRIPISPFVAQAAVVTVTVAMTFGLFRYRVPVDVAMCVLSGIGIAGLLAWVGDRRADGVRSASSWFAAVLDAVAVLFGKLRRRVLDAGPRMRLGVVALVVLLAVAFIWSASASPVAPEVIPT